MAGLPAYLPPRWLRNGHLQSVLSSAHPRRRQGLRRMQQLRATTEELILDGGDGIRLQAWLSRVPEQPPRALALLLHGWEGSAESGYVRQTAASLLSAGAWVVRLNFRDHGDTHHLNPGLFHSARLSEVVNAAGDLSRRYPGLDLVAGGYSLGGNFALRLALQAPGAGLALHRVAAVCPVVDPAHAMDRLEQGVGLYARYFHRKWTDSLRRKRAAFPVEMAECNEHVLSQDLRGLTAWLARRYAGFDSLADYFQAYSIAGDRMAALAVPAAVLMAADDPVIPLVDFQQWQQPDHLQLTVTDHGGHCGFLHNLRGDGYAEQWMCQHLLPDSAAGIA